MDKMRSMEVFVRVVDAGSFSAAARTLDMSTVMVSKHIAALEQLVGARLLHRTTRSQSLSEIGRQYAEQCRHILQLVHAAETGALAMRMVPRGTLKISAPAAFGSRCLAPAMAEYLESNPEVNLELDLSNRLSDLVEEGLDAAVRIGPLKDSTMVARPLRSLQMMVCAAPGYLARHGTPRTPGELSQHRCLDFSHWRHDARWRLGQLGTEEGTSPIAACARTMAKPCAWRPSRDWAWSCRQTPCWLTKLAPDGCFLSCVTTGRRHARCI